MRSAFLVLAVACVVARVAAIFPETAFGWDAATQTWSLATAERVATFNPRTVAVNHQRFLRVLNQGGHDNGHDDDNDHSGALCKHARDAIAARQLVQKNVVAQYVYGNTIWPNPVSIVATGLIPGAPFIDNVVGSVKPLATFNGMDHSLEYWYGLASGASHVTDLQWHHLEATNNIVFSHVDLVLRNPASPVSTNFTHVSSFAFNANNQICGYDTYFVEIGVKLDPPFDPTQTGRWSNRQLATITGTCQGIQALCRGPLQQYANVSDCVAFMKTKAYGSWDQADQDTFTCRLFHLSLARVHPDPHCYHSGPSGGLDHGVPRCVPHAYTDYEKAQRLACRDPVLYHDPVPA